MNFTGRYWTENGTCVAVHIIADEITDTLGNQCCYRGHEIRLDPPFTDNRVFFWNESGKCLLVFGTVDATSKFDLKERVNPQTNASEMECVDCEDCKMERRSKLYAPTTS